MPRGGRVKQYPEDLKQTVIEMTMRGDRSAKAVAEELGISPKRLYGWLRKYRQEHGLNSKDEVKQESMEEELKRLRRENARLKMEREILTDVTHPITKLRGHCWQEDEARRRVVAEATIRRRNDVIVSAMATPRA